MHDLTSTVGIVAIAAGAVAVMALLISVVLAFRLRRLRSEQRAVLGDHGEDLVAHAASLQQPVRGAARVRRGRLRSGSTSG